MESFQRGTYEKFDSKWEPGHLFSSYSRLSLGRLDCSCASQKKFLLKWRRNKLDDKTVWTTLKKNCNNYLSPLIEFSILIARKLACMKKRSNQTWFFTNLNNRAADGAFQIANRVRTEIGQLPVFEVIPKPFIGIQIRSVRRQKLSVQPLPGLAHELLGNFRAVNRAPVPKHNHPMPKMPLQMLEKKNDFPGANASIGQHQIQTPAAADRRNSRKLGPGGTMPQNRCFAPGRPRPDTGGV